MPKISVIMSVYNDDKYLASAIDSILNQTYRNFEFIICDDGSNDSSLEILDKYKSSDSRIIIIRNDKNLGLAASLNKCIDLARGEYIARMDSDDFSIKERFEYQLNYFEKNNEISILGGEVNLFDEDGIYGTRSNRDQYNKVNIFLKNFFVHPTVMIKKLALIEVGGYTVSKETYRTEDYDLWCKLYAKGYKGHNLNRVLLNYREDKNAYSKRKYKYRIDAYKLRRKWYRELEIPFKYIIYSYKPLIVGMIPSYIMRKYHKNKSQKVSRIT